MTAQTPAPPQDPQSPSASPPEPQSKPGRRRGAIGIVIVLAFVAVYCLSLFGVHALAGSSRLPAVDHEPGDDTVVSVRLDKLDAAANRLTVKVMVIPPKSMYNPQLRVLNTDLSVRFYPDNDQGDLVYPAGKAPAMVTTTLEAHGDSGTWPFDSYSTDTLSADVLVGQGDARKYVPARVEIEGYLDGWSVSITRVRDSDDPPDVQDNAIITLHRAKGPLIFDLGICLVLFALPAMAFGVVVPIALRKRKFVPPFGGWFAALLFAVIPIRNFLPGAPPPGAWIDQVLVLWVLIGLVGAMVLYMISWYRQSD